MCEQLKKTSQKKKMLVKWNIWKVKKKQKKTAAII